MNIQQEHEGSHQPADRRFTAVERYSSVARTVEILSDAWGFLVLRECFFGVRRFEQFQSCLEVPRKTLVARLTKLVEVGVIQRIPIGEGRRRHEYRLTTMGRDLYPTMMALMGFGDKWLTQGRPKPLQLFHKACGHTCDPKIACSRCHVEIEPRQVRFRDGPGAGSEIREEERKRTRRISDPHLLERGRPCSVARTLQVIGDRWSFLIIREFFFGVRRFDEFQDRLGIAPNILSDRLGRLYDSEFIDKNEYQHNPPRHEYRLSTKGRDLYGAMLVMMAWGDKWFFNAVPPIRLRHQVCGHDFHAEVVCNACGEPMKAVDMSYALNYSEEKNSQLSQRKIKTLTATS